MTDFAPLVIRNCHRLVPLFREILLRAYAKNQGVGCRKYPVQSHLRLAGSAKFSVAVEVL
ncbi:hypothetical protein [Paenibacillus sp. R14(2021)]|uniref:hypothetical protein n=1 Tax=Paenibacillus sp. R14(2021) TaxID=2859228 RepID=UPI001C61324A|nr:hypothetical protein [Paenibacillus sp. R14(2021)]